MWLRLYAYGLLGSLYLDQWLWFVYLLHLGYSPAQIGVAYAVMQAFRFAFDIPSSMFADRFGQRPVLFAAGILKAVSSVLLLFAGRGLGVVVAASAFAALALTLPSGVDLSYVRSLAERHVSHGNAMRLQFRLSRFMSMQALAGVGAGLLGGLIASASFPLLYETDAAFSLLAAGLALSLPRVRTAQQVPTPKASWRAPFADAAKALRSAQPAFWRVAALVIPLWTFSSVGTEYTQALLHGIGMQPFVISLAFTLAGGCAWIGALVSGRIPEHRRTSTLRWTVWLYPVAAAIRALAAPRRAFATTAGVGGIAVGRLGSGLSNVLVNAALLEDAPAAHRATALSVVNSIQMAAMMLVFPALGLLAGARGIGFVFALLAGGLAVVAAGLQVALRPRGPETVRRAV